MGQFATPGDGDEEVQLSQNGAEDFETAADEGRGDEPASPHPDVEGAISGFVEAVVGVAIGSEDCDLVTKVLQTDCGVDE